MIVNTDWSKIDKVNLDSCIVFRSYSASFSIRPQGAWEGTLYYSIDGITWQEVVKNQYITSQFVNDSYSIYMKGINNTVITGSSNNGWGKILLRDIYVFGNIETLLDYRTVLNGQHPTMGDYAFYGLFTNWDKLVSAPALPARSLSDYCYAFMFDSCTSLTVAPAVPALTLANHCYRSMFRNCSSLIATPALPATTLAEYCYHYMFRGCTSLTTVPASLPATSLKRYCYTGMFHTCSSLTTAPALPATSLDGAQTCYAYMFHGCSSLTAAPALPATTLDVDCYMYMFQDCTSLTTAPALPARTLATGCYEDMFRHCTALTTAPSLSAVRSLSSYSCSSMFAECTSLTTIPAIPDVWIGGSGGAYNSMFRMCKSVKISATQDSTYTHLLVRAKNTSESNYNSYVDMFYGTTGPFTGTPTPGVTYYTSNPVV